MKILVIRFRQMGDAIIATSVLNTLRHISRMQISIFVLNERLASLFEGHHSINRIITFTEKERHSPFVYAKKVWEIVHTTHYDVIIDLRSTFNTMLFSLFSLSTTYRIGVKKNYTRWVFNYQISDSVVDEDMVRHDLEFVKPLNKIREIELIRDFTLEINEEELERYRTYMQYAGIDFSKPVVLVGVTSKLDRKTWSEENMVWLLRMFIQQYPDVQLIFNYAPGKEEVIARRIYSCLSTKNVFIDIKAESMRQLVAMSELITFYFGNEGGARHIVHAVGHPSYVICSPEAKKKIWIPINKIPSEAIDIYDFASESEMLSLDNQQRYALITKERVWAGLETFIKENNLL